MPIVTAVLGDSMREVLDARTTKVLVVATLTLTAVCASFRVERLPPEEALKGIVKDIELPFALRGKKIDPAHDPQVHLAAPIRALTDQDWHPRGYQGGYLVKLAVDNPEAFADRVERVVQEGQEPTVGDAETYITDRFGREGIDTAIPMFVEDPLVFNVHVYEHDWDEVSHSARVTTLFGAVEVPMKNLSLAHLLIRLQFGIAVFIAGIGVVVAVIVTAGCVPQMIARGTADLVLSKPISRTRLLLYKYVGGLLFVLLHGTLLIGATWVALAWRFSWWNPGYLGSALALDAFFAILYSVSVLAGVLSRTVVPPILASFGLWFLCLFLGMFQTWREEGVLGWVPERAFRMIRLLYLLFPKTTDLNGVAMWFIARGRSSAALLKDLELDRPLDLTLIVGSSGAFVLIILAIACWVFSRRDY